MLDIKAAIVNTRKHPLKQYPKDEQLRIPKNNIHTSSFVQNNLVREDEEEQKQPMHALRDDFLNSVDLMSETGRSINEFNDINEKSNHRRDHIKEQIASHRFKIPSVSKQQLSERSSQLVNQ